MTPEALDSKWVQIEWQSFFTRRPTDLFPVRLVDADLSAFLEPIQWIDFQGLEGADYRARLRQLFGDLLRRDRRDPPPMPDDLLAPKFPEPDPDRQRLETCLAPLLESRARRRLLAPALGLRRDVFDDSKGVRAARRLLAVARFSEEPLANWIGVTHLLIKELEEDWPDEVEPLRLLETDLRCKQEEIESRRQREAADRDDPGSSGTGNDPVPAYLAQVARDHENLIPLFDQRRAPLLDHVYVDLKLRDDERFRAPEAKGRTFIHSMTIHQVLDLEPAEYPWVTRRWVILGDPGAGKTTLMRHLARELALEGRRTLVPVFESLPRLLREDGWLLQRLEKQLVQGGEEGKGLAATLDSLGQRGELLVQLDGLDEVPRDQKHAAASLLRRLSARWPETPILVTSRPIGYHHPGEGFRELEVQRFDGEQRLDFLTHWLGGDADRARQALEAIDTHRSVRNLAGNPLYLTLMAILVEQGESPSQNRAHLYNQIFELLLEGRHKRPPQPMPLVDDCRETLRQLAFAMTAANLHAESVGQIERRFWNEEGIRQAAQPIVARWGDVRPFLSDLAEKTGILGPHDGADTDWRYWHRSFREALASEVLAQRYETGGQAAVLDAARQIKGDEGRWAEAFALLTGRIDEPDAVVKSLVATKRDLGLRALVSAPVLDVSTIGDVLSLTDNSAERAEVYLQIPDLLPDAPSALGLIDRLRVEARKGYDLYHLDLAAELVAGKPGWSDHSRAARQLRDQLYDHLPPPPADLFDTIETRDGPVPLWREISPGHFVMGSQQDEGEHWGGEGPPHEVEVPSGFRIAVVPVTRAQFAAFDPGHGVEARGVDELCPVVSVCWYEAVAFCRWLATRGQLGAARLPTESEWEFACRAGTTTRYWSGDSEGDLDRVGWYEEHKLDNPQRVGQKLASPWGLYDMHGNVDEWTASSWISYHEERDPKVLYVSLGFDGTDLTPRPAESTDSGTSPAMASRVNRVIRGGSYTDSALRTRSASRYQFGPGSRSQSRGFRVLLPFASRSS